MSASDRRDSNAMDDRDAGDRPAYPFLNHSSSTLPMNLPPSTDLQPLMRQKRKRTSPEDQSILETAYKRDSKPDRSARLRIVEQVALNEKEVQIWFQNRRQSSRRKSRPLLPHEVVQYQISRPSQAGPMSCPPSSSSTSQIDDRVDVAAELRDDKQMLAKDHNVISSNPHTSNPLSFSSSSAPATHTSNDTVALSDAPTSFSSPPPSCPDAHKQNADGPLQQIDSTSAHDQKDSSTYVSTSLPRGITKLPGLRKSTSYVRLSMSFDGNASVVTKDGTSPSPPRAAQTVLLPMQNAVSSSGPIDTFDFSLRKDVRGLSSGRSRDSRTWEFWCDKNSRTELEKKAEREANGSAADAIGLLRSSSGRSILAPISNKRNALFSRHVPEAKRAKPSQDVPDLQRSKTSSGRLQGENLNQEFFAPKAKLKISASAISVDVPGNDSDKENWSPVVGGPIDRERHIQMADPKAATKENRRIEPRKEHRAGKTRDGTRCHGHVVNDPENDAEVAAFMRGSRQNSTGSSSSSPDDLDCIHGLLSLSQGNWR